MKNNRKKCTSSFVHKNINVKTDLQNVGLTIKWFYKGLLNDIKTQ